MTDERRKARRRIQAVQNKNDAVKQIALLALAEIIISAVICLVYFLLGHFSYKVVTGVLLGSVVTVANFVFLTLSVNRAIDRYLELRGTREMDEEEAEKFASEHAMAVQNAATRSFIIRTVTMLAAFVVAFLLEWFEPLATVIPLLMFRPILYALEALKKKKGNS